MTYKECYLYTNSFRSHHWKKLLCCFSSKYGSDRTFSHTFSWFSEKSEVFWSLWLIKSATSIQTVFTVIIGINFSADFQLKTGVRELFLKLFHLSSENSEVFSSLWLIRSATSIQTVFTLIIGKNYSADFHLNTGKSGLFLTLFFCSSEKSEVFWSLWLIRSATSIQTVFTVNIGKKISADFHLNTRVRGLFLTLFLVFWKEWRFFILMTNKECYFYTNSFYSHHWKSFSCWFSIKNGSERTFSNTF